MNRPALRFAQFLLAAGVWAATYLIGSEQACASPEADIACCVTTRELQQVGACVSGPGGLVAGDDCPKAGLCYVSAGALVQGLADEVAAEQHVGPLPSRAVCTSELRPGTVQLVRFGDNIELFSVFDMEQDGDLDLRDVAAYLNSYEPAPYRVQPDVHLLSAECCFSRDERQRVAGCLSGPKRAFPAGDCDEQGTCLLRFSALVRPGDLLHRMCESGPFIQPPPSDLPCERIPADDNGAAPFMCIAGRNSGITALETLDADGDADFDLLDFARFQNQFE